MALNSQALKGQAIKTMSSFSAGQRTVVAIAILALAAGGFMFSQWAAKPNMVPLFSNLDSTDASAITGKLQSSNTAYELTDGGKTILVPQKNVYQLRLDMASENLPSGGNSGYSLLDKQGITTSDFMQQVGYQRALEGELAKTISSIDSIEAASVHLVMPKSDVFAGDAKKPTASVLVKTKASQQLTNSQIQSVVNLTASSVESMSPSDVTLADDKGRMLAAPGQQIGGAGDDKNTEATKGYEDTLTSKLQNLLVPLVGNGNAVVKTNAELNFDKSKITNEEWNPDDRTQALNSQHVKVENYGGEGGANGATGCLGTEILVNNVCIPAEGAENAENQYVNSERTTDFHSDHRLTQTETAVGTPRRISVAVLLNSNVANVDTARVEQLVTQAAGLQAERGDTITVDRMPFDLSGAEAAQKDLETAKSAEQRDQLIEIAKIVGAVLLVTAVLIILFLATKKREENYTATPISLAEFDAMGSRSAPEPIATSQPIELEQPSPEAIERDKVDREISTLIEKQPDEVAQLLRSWLADRRG